MKMTAPDRKALSIYQGHTDIEMRGMGSMPWGLGEEGLAYRVPPQTQTAQQILICEF